MTIEEYQKYCKKMAIRLADCRGKKSKVIKVLEDFVYVSLTFVNDSERSLRASREDRDLIKSKIIETLDDLIRLYESGGRKLQVYCLNRVKNDLKYGSNIIRVVK